MPDLSSKIQTAVPLAPLTTLKLGGNAAHFMTIAHPAELAQAMTWANRSGLPVLVLGGGSNVVLADSGFPGLVMQMNTRGIHVQSAAAGVEVQVAAGEPWDAFVEYATKQGWAGVECLSGIPGSVGATPIQNVGAYGQDVSQTIARVRVLDRKSLRTQWLKPEDLAFAYRDSWLRRNPDAFVVLDVVFQLHTRAPEAAKYGELAQALGAIQDPSLEQIRQTVLHLRRKKSMVLDPLDPNTASAGSFFTNPIVRQQRAEHVVAVALNCGYAAQPSEVPQWRVSDDHVKLAAGWLIEKAGFPRGLRQGAVGISSAHALALVHYGGGTAQELVALARRIQRGVYEVFNVALSAEPVFVGLSL